MSRPLWQSIPLFIIILSLLSSSTTSVMRRRAAKAVCLTAVSLTLIMNAALLFMLARANTSYVYPMGHFPAPWGNELRAGPLEALIGTAFSAILLMSLLGGMHRFDEHIDADKQPLYFVAIELLQTSLMALVYTNDLFTAYVFVEILTLSACSIITARSKGRTLVAATRYMIMNLLGSGLFLIGVSMLYGITGHLLMEYIKPQVLVAAQSYREPMTVVVALISIGLAIKSALFPFHTWLPDAYGYSTPSSSAMLSSLVSKGYIFLLLKVFYRVIGFQYIRQSQIATILFIFGLAGVIMGSLSAIREKDIRRMISFSSVAQIGYIYMGIGMGTEAGMVAAVFHILAHGAAKSMLFLSAGGLSEVSGDSKLFRDLRGSGYRNRAAGVAFTIGAFSMVGIPLMGGFITKLCLGSAAMELTGARLPLVLGVLALSTVLNTIYFLKTVLTIYRPPVRDWPEGFRPARAFVAAMAAFVLANVALGVCSAPILALIREGLALFA